MQSLVKTRNHIINVEFYLEAKGFKDKKREMNVKSVTEQTKIATLTVTPSDCHLIIGFYVYCQS